MIECLVFCEARGDAEVVQLLVDRLLAEVRPPGELERIRRWRGDGGEDCRRFVKWTALKKRGGRIRVHGGYGGPNRGEYLQARKALAWAALAHPEANAVVLMRDDDGYGRRPDFDAARADGHGARATVVAVPAPEVEAWCIVAFDALDPPERARQAAVQRALGAAPQAVAHTLSPQRDDHPRGTKRVLDALSGGDGARALDGLRVVPIETLRQRGAQVGLTAFIDEVRARLVPLLER